MLGGGGLCRGRSGHLLTFSPQRRHELTPRFALHSRSLFLEQMFLRLRHGSDTAPGPGGAAGEKEDAGEPCPCGVCIPVAVGQVSSWEDLMLMNPAETNTQGWQGHGRNLRLSREVREGLTEKLMLEGVREQAVHTSQGTASQAEGTAYANTVGMFRKLPHVAGGQPGSKETVGGGQRVTNRAGPGVGGQRVTNGAGPGAVGWRVMNGVGPGAGGWRVTNGAGPGVDGWRG